MNRPAVVMIASIAILGLLGVILMQNDRRGLPTGQESGGSVEPVMLYCAASNRGVIEDIRANYETEYGRSVQIQYGSSQLLLSSLEVSRTGDLFLPADDSYIDLAREQGLIDEVLPLAVMQAVIAVPRGNPKQIHTLADLLRDDVRFVQASPDSAAIGKVTRDLLSKTGNWKALEAATIAFRSTITDVANDITVGAADAGVVYSAVLFDFPQLEAIAVPELAPAASRIMIAVARSTRQAPAALHFARYVAARNRGLVHYEERGFIPEAGDVWEDEPELTIFAGSMLRPAIDETVAAFEQREGVRVTRIYNGCGILVAQMRSGEPPDAYFACDQEFMDQVADLFPESVEVSQNELVILVSKGNPHGISSLRDLTRPGLRVGIGHEKQCAMGWLTQNTLKEGGVQQEVMQNVTLQSPTGDLLVNQLRTGSLDAAVAYLSNAAGAGDVLDAVRIDGIPCSVATQPFAIAQKSRYHQLATRLFQHLSSPESREIFLAEGFRWQLAESGEARP